MGRTFDELLAEDMAMFFGDPLGFVMYAFPWDSDPGIQIVELEEPWKSRYNCKFGPDVWFCELCDDVADAVRENSFDGKTPVPAQRHAISSGHGIGKSSGSAFIVLWILSTRPHAKGVMTANTSDQLNSKTWAELGKWRKKCITGHWFSMTTGKGSMSIRHVDFPATWRCDAQTSKEENSESFAGLHAANSSPFYIFDEASAVPKKIWEVAEGGLSTGEPFFFAWGNGTRNSGAFFDAFHVQRHRWRTRQIDSRSVKITNKQLIEEWKNDYGEDSDFFRIRVRGLFPKSSSDQFIASDVVQKARKRVPNAHTIKGRTAAIGVDVARFGDDETCIKTRIGRDAKTFPAIRMQGRDTMFVANRVAGHANALIEAGYSVLLFIDGGGVGAGVVDRLRERGYDVIEVQFGSAADDERKYANKRAEIWGRMRDWLQGASIEDSEEMETDLCSCLYDYVKDGQILLESKKSMKKRGLASPDRGDALALTFAATFPEIAESNAPAPARKHTQTKYDPYAYQNHDYDPYKNV